MKRALILAVALVFVVTGISFAGVVGSKHDLATGSDYTGATLSACQYCHTPHLRNNTAVTGAPLWNRAQGSDGTWTLYSGLISGNTVNEPGPNSKTCLSCHDGTIAVGDVLLPTTGGGTIAGAALTGGFLDEAKSWADLTTDLSNEHPIGVDASTGDAGLLSIAAMESNGLKFYSNRIECASCHDPHDTTNPPFLRVAKDGICTDCHANK